MTKWIKYTVLKFLFKLKQMFHCLQSYQINIPGPICGQKNISLVDAISIPPPLPSSVPLLPARKGLTMIPPRPLHSARELPETPAPFDSFMHARRHDDNHSTLPYSAGRHDDNHSTLTYNTSIATYGSESQTVQSIDSTQPLVKPPKKFNIPFSITALKKTLKVPNNTPVIAPKPTSRTWQHSVGQIIAVNTRYEDQTNYCSQYSLWGSDKLLQSILVMRIRQIIAAKTRYADQTIYCSQLILVMRIRQIIAVNIRHVDQTNYFSQYSLWLSILIRIKQFFCNQFSSLWYNNVKILQTGSDSSQSIDIETFNVSISCGDFSKSEIVGLQYHQKNEAHEWFIHKPHDGSFTTPEIHS